MRYINLRLTYLLAYSYNGGLIESRTCSIEPRHFK